jgi:hypothetical protein
LLAMRRIHTLVAFLLVALSVSQVPAVTAYACRMDGEIHAACCCNSEDCASAEVDCSCCDVFEVKIKASATPSPSCPHPETGAVRCALGSEQLTDGWLLQSDSSFTRAHSSAGDLPPPSRIALCIQRI